MTLSEEQREILSRGTEEVVPDIEDAGKLLEPDSTAYVGYEPSGRLHLGHMLTAQKLKDLEEIGMETNVLLADRHAYLNGKPSGVSDKESRDFISDIADMYEVALDAFGLEADIIRGSEFQDGASYSMVRDDLLRNIPQKQNERAIADIAGTETRSAGQVIYPTMQVADMYHLGKEGKKVDVAVGGIDQRAIHMLARDYQPQGFDEEDKPAAVHTPIIGENIGDGEKMSSSGSSIQVYAEREDIEDGVNPMFLPTDVQSLKSRYGEETVQELQENGFTEEDLIYNSSPVLQLVNHYTFIRDEEFEVNRPDQYGGDVTYDSGGELIEDMTSGEMHPADVKNGLTDLLYEQFEEPREAVLDQGLHKRVEELYDQ